MVVWASNCATLALLCGIPAFYCAPHHVLEGALGRDLRMIDSPFHFDRRSAFESMAWAQWTMEEIEQGAPFRHLLRP